jgi:hypothetical protein
MGVRKTSTVKHPYPKVTGIEKKNPFTVKSHWSRGRNVSDTG